jgi:hypothetical protein
VVWTLIDIMDLYYSIYYEYDHWDKIGMKWNRKWTGMGSI